MKGIRRLVREELEKIVEVQPPYEFGKSERDPMDDDPKVLWTYINDYKRYWLRAQEFVASTSEIMYDDELSDEDKLLLIYNLLDNYH